MAEQPCDRCEKKERIPTDQGIKFYDENSYLCTPCFDQYTKIMNGKRHGGARAGKPSHLERKISGECGVCGETTEPIPEDNKVKNLRTLVEHYLCDNDWETFITWYAQRKHQKLPDVF